MNKTSDFQQFYPSTASWSMKLPEIAVYEMLDRSVERFGGQICTQFIGSTMTYAQIGAAVERAACGLQKMGVVKGDKIGILLPNCPTFLIAYFAILKIGATVVNFNPLYTVEELEFQVRDSKTRIMITLDLAMIFNKAERLLERGVLDHAVTENFASLLPCLKSFLFRLFKSKEIAKPDKSGQADKITHMSALMDNDGGFTPVSINPAEDIAVLQYTGGTTGTPKGAMLTHANLSVNVAQVASWAEELEDGKERIMGVLPLFHVFAMTTVMNFGVYSGCEIVLVPRFDLTETLKLMASVRPTIFPGVPTIYNAMLHHPEITKFDLSSLKFSLSGGAPLPIEVKRGFEKVAGSKLVEGYGLSETSPVATCNPVNGPVKEGSIGIPMPQTRIAIRSLEDPDTDVEPGEKGEICIAGPQVMKSYWMKPDETADSFSGDFLRTGDVGYIDEEGFIFIVDRIKDLIICGGYNVYPRRIEEAIYEHPAVEEVTVIGIPDDYRGEAPKAFIKLRSGKTADTEDIMEFLKPKLSKIELPKVIEFRDELPKTMIGKLSKKELREEEPASP